MPIKAVLCTNCPWRRSAPKAGEVGGSVPVSTNRDHMRQVAHNVTEGLYFTAQFKQVRIVFNRSTKVVVAKAPKSHKKQDTCTLVWRDGVLTPKSVETLSRKYNLKPPCST